MKRRTGRVIHGTTDGTPGQPMIPASDTRVALVLSAVTSGAHFWSTEDSTAASMGIMIPSGGSPITLSMEVHGDVVKKAWFVSNTIAGSIAWLETHELE